MDVAPLFGNGGAAVAFGFDSGNVTTYGSEAGRPGLLVNEAPPFGG